MLIREQRELHKDEPNCGPLSEVIAFGTPKRLNHVENRAFAQSEAEVDDRGIVSGQRVVLSMMVNK